MPALRSLCTISILTACLAQAWAGPAHNAALRRDDHLGGDEKESHGGFGGYGGEDKSYDDQGGWEDYNADYHKPEYKPEAEPAGNVIVTITQWATVTAPAPEQKNVPPQTVTITAVAPCDKNVVTATAYVTTCPVSPAPEVAVPAKDCKPCEAGGKPAWPSVPANAGGLGNCPVVTTSNLKLGLTSIPAEQAVKTGVTVAGPATGAAPAVTAGAPPPPAFPAVTELYVSTLQSIVSAAPLMAFGGIGTGSVGKGIWGAPDAYSAEHAGEWTVYLGETFVTTGPIVPGLGSIPNTAVVPAGPPVASLTAQSAPPTPPAVPSPSPAVSPAGLSAGVFASEASPIVSPVVPTTTTTTSANASSSTAQSPSESPSEKTLTSSSSSPVSRTAAEAAPLSATTALQTDISYGNSGMLGIGKRYVVVPTALL